jgi:hypothetical protein
MQFEEETGVQKFTRRLKEEPLVPLGIHPHKASYYDRPPKSRKS